ncbi:MAG: sarcosine oxidase subunit beta family protein [Gammaproteobacteria bacterium]|nr:sarcosine oxidase subunit beta family protein [Gammaproteobacteria bacterium]NIM72401.1 sarcosine oxidase subunit beta family protein [Gammaproteobacteria bacterium]NIN37268.1 sarcosine oxidase subunit beta family protein [Gammaproteobacteria bacterium]NIO24158.1 sarcosine oxidase subunit beta family protein [Gammaproteobacteria bacterium]NIO64765.1 sarcosine oxidase subunit beta family protein [Gammaproteobacteria bacterium]
MRYSVFSLTRNALGYHRGWSRAWRSPEPRPRYDVIIIGGGGHGLATAYYLAKNHGITNVAVVEKGWLGGGNTGRNTTIVRSNYMLEANAHFYEHSLKLWEGLSQDLNFNVMFSQRGVINLAHSDPQLDAFNRRGNAMRLNGIDAVLLSREDVARRVPLLDCSPTARFPIMGGLLQPRGGVARHDAVAWGFARAADAHGVDIIQNCEVTGIRREGARVVGVETTRGAIGAGKIGIVVAGNSSRLAAMADVRLPIESHVLQAMVTEPLKPVLDTVVTSGATHLYISQTDKGEILMGGDLDGYNSYAQRGNLPLIEHVVAGAVSLFPFLSRLRMMRTWGGVMDMTMDGSPIIGKLPVEGLYMNGGWCYGGFKATPGSGWVFADTIAHDRPHPLNESFTLERFNTGYLLDEKGAGATPGAH